jgi:acetyltransferase-like isoleucine patch superfamily enzyme
MGLAREFKLTRTVARLNGIIHRSRLATKFVSLFLAELNLEGRIIYCNAGHPAALVIRADGSVSFLRSGGMILGPNPNARYTFGIEVLHPGDLLVLYTDGITEATSDPDGEEYGSDRLIHALRTARHLDPIAVVDRVFSDVEEFTAVSPPADDQTIDFRPAAFFDLDGFAHSGLFDREEPVWSALGNRLVDYLEGWSDWSINVDLAQGVHLMGERIFIGPGCSIEPGAVIVGPVILDEGVQIRTGAYVRQHVVLAAGSLVGAHSEVKGSVLLPGAKAPHQAYVGDSILGRDVNLGAGTICSNVKNVGREISFSAGGQTYHTGLRKFGAVLGDGCKTGCNTVLNPGVLMGPGSVTYTNASIRGGFYPAGTLVKVRQTQQVTEMRKLKR